MRFEVQNKDRMSRQKQISNEISMKKGHIKEIDQQISQQRSKQQILDELLRELDLSSSNGTSSGSSILSHHGQQNVQDYHAQSFPSGLAKEQAEVSDMDSINSGDLSFEIEKIRLFQNQYKPNQHSTKKFQIPKSRQLDPESTTKSYKYTVPKHFNVAQKYQRQNLSQFKEQCCAPKTYVKNLNEQQHSKKVKFDEQKNLQHKTNKMIPFPPQKLITFQHPSISQIHIDDLVDKNEKELILNQTKKIAFLQSKELQQKIRIQRLQQEKRLIREQLLKQLVPKSFDPSENYQEKEKSNLNETQRNSQFIGKSIISSTIGLEETMKRGCSKTKKYLGYIKKNIAQMNETQQKIQFYRKSILNGR